MSLTPQPAPPPRLINLSGFSIPAVEFAHEVTVAALQPSVYLFHFGDVLSFTLRAFAIFTT